MTKELAESFSTEQGTSVDVFAETGFVCTTVLSAPSPFIVPDCSETLSLGCSSFFGDVELSESQAVKTKATIAADRNSFLSINFPFLWNKRLPS
ncbi:MAG: hypothetical protein IJ912_03035 [Fibrobacter sp.]|nr:hypothetical protein [Fibrobacter sp.]